MQTVPRLYEQFQPAHYDLNLTLEREKRAFHGSVAIQGYRQTTDSGITLHVKDLTVTNARVDGVATDFTVDNESDSLLIKTDSSNTDVTIVVEFFSTISDGMHGLYPCYYSENDTKKEILATQFESHHAREVFPCVDEPEAKATFGLTLTTETGVEVLSNMPVREQQTTDEKTKVTSFETTPKMSTYLLAWVVGDLHKKSAKTKSGVEVNVWATKAQSLDSLDFPLEVATKSIDFFDEYFLTPYPLPKADHVALPDFSSGAMENWGLITYREVALLIDQHSSLGAREWCALVIAHETSHQWFGNLVTMKWWDDLWLNESFASVMEYFAVDALYPDWEIWNVFASSDVLSALRRDQLAGVQAVKCEVNHPDEISTLFDPSIVYAKGGRLLKMLKAYIGEEAFRAGLQAYFKKHAYGNTVGADLWRAFSEASRKDIEAFMDTWVSQPGLPLVSLSTTTGGYELSQERFIVGGETDGSMWPIPLFALDESLPKLLETKTLASSGESDVPLLNHDSNAHFVTHYDSEAWQKILKALEGDRFDIADRLALLHEAGLLTRAGKLDTASLIPLLGVYENEADEPVWNIIAMCIADLKRFVEDDAKAEKSLKALVTRTCLPQYERLGFDVTGGEHEQDTKLRAIILGLLSYAEHPEVVEQGLKAFRSADELGALPSETRAIVFGVATKYGSEADFERLLTLHNSTANPELRDDVASGLCTTREISQITRLLARVTDSSQVKAQDVIRWFIYLLRNRHAKTQAWQWMVDNWGWIDQTFKGDKSYDNFARYSASALATREWLDAYTTFFEPLKAQSALKRTIEIGATEITSRVEWLERDGESVRTTLAQETA